MTPLYFVVQMVARLGPPLGAVLVVLKLVGILDVSWWVATSPWLIQLLIVVGLSVLIRVLEGFARWVAARS